MEWLYHIATVPDWDQAQRDGEYRTSTRGRSLSDRPRVDLRYSPSR